MAITAAGGVERLAPAYSAVPGLEIFNTGHNLKVLGDFGDIVVGGITYSAIQFHFHLLSEHTVDGEHYHAEMHIVHASEDAGLLVIGLLFEVIATDDDNEFLKSIKFEQAPNRKSGGNVALDGDVDLNYFSDIFEGDYYRYKGSLTTPPCSETVEWFVMATASTISPSQFAYFQSIFPNPSNYRPVMPLNGRTILESSTFLGTDEECVLGADLCGENLVCHRGKCAPFSAASKKKKSSGYSFSELLSGIFIAFSVGALIAFALSLQYIRAPPVALVKKNEKVPSFAASATRV